MNFDGFRGKANETLIADHVYKIGRFIGWYYGELKKSSELSKGFVVYPQYLKNVRVEDKAKFLNNTELQKKISKISEQLGETGRVLVHPSGIEPVIRVMAEAETKEQCENIVNQIADIIGGNEK